jgi:hypothetical protein
MFVTDDLELLVLLSETLTYLKISENLEEIT